MDTNNSGFGLYSEIKSEKVEWLWYPYIPMGKITMIQGDPGCGKSTLIMDIIGKLTTGKPMPDGMKRPIMNVIYQCSEDGIADTIKPRLEKVNADCSHIGYIKEDMCGLSLDDELIRNTIIEMKAKLLVVDPFQAYVGDSDLSSAIGMRRIMRRLSMWASATNCAIVLVGHLNKKSGTNELYRGLGSIDIVAAPRSVVQVEINPYEPEMRVIKHIKSSLSSKGNDVYYTINQDGVLNWLDGKETIIMSDDNELEDVFTPQTKQESATEMIVEILKHGPVEAAIASKKLVEAGYSDRTIKYVKKTIAVSSVKIKNKWYWSLPNYGEDNVKEI